MAKKKNQPFHIANKLKQFELKGTLPPTKITKAKVKTKRRTQEQILLDREKEKSTISYCK